MAGRNEKDFLGGLLYGFGTAAGQEIGRNKELARELSREQHRSALRRKEEMLRREYEEEQALKQREYDAEDIFLKDRLSTQRQKQKYDLMKDLLNYKNSLRESEFSNPDNLSVYMDMEDSLSQRDYFNYADLEDLKGKAIAAGIDFDDSMVSPILEGDKKFLGLFPKAGGYYPDPNNPDSLRYTMRNAQAAAPSADPAAMQNAGAAPDMAFETDEDLAATNPPSGRYYINSRKAYVVWEKE